jgi:hypothetical protein
VGVLTDTLDLVQLAIFGFATGLGTTFGAKIASLLFERFERRVKREKGGVAS